MTQALVSENNGVQTFLVTPESGVREYFWYEWTCPDCGGKAASHMNYGRPIKCLGCSQKCCLKSQMLECVCYYAQRCEEHGEKHSGSHE